jgi:hypothetical protein
MRLGEGSAFDENVFKKVKVGDKIGGIHQKPVEEAGGIKRIVPVDMRTPFVLEDIVGGIDRILYYQIELKRNVPGQMPEFIFSIRQQTKSTQRVRLLNTKTKATTELLKVDIIARIQSTPKKLFYPAFSPLDDKGNYDEEKAFRAAPMTYVNALATPPAPLCRSLADQRFKDWFLAEAKRAEHPIFDVTSITAPVVLLADGRVLYIDPLNTDRIMQFTLKRTPSEVEVFWRQWIAEDKKSIEDAGLGIGKGPIGPNGLPILGAPATPPPKEGAAPTEETPPVDKPAPAPE